LWKIHTLDIADLCGSTENGSLTSYDLYLNVLNDLKKLMLNAAHTFAKLFMESIIKGDIVSGDSEGLPTEVRDAAPLSPSRQQSVDPRLSSSSTRQEDGLGYSRSAFTTKDTSMDLGGDSQHSDEAQSTGGSSQDVAKTALWRQRNHLVCVEMMRAVVSRLTADCKLTIHKSFVILLTNALESTVQELIIAPSYEVASLLLLLMPCNAAYHAVHRLPWERRSC
jgi:hypothetical protein